MTDEYKMGKDLEGSSRDLIDQLCTKFPIGTEENHENPQLGYPMSRVEIRFYNIQNISLGRNLCGFWKNSES
jgi:hypothetical protein